MTEFNIKEAAFSVEHDPQGRFWNSRWNLHEEVLTQYSLPNKVTVTDSTIREGEEAPHVVYRLEDKLRITRLLDEMNVHEIDCGFASVNQGHLDFLKALKKEGLRIRKSAIARIDLPDYKKGIDRLLEAGADIVLCALYPTPLPGYDWPDYCRRVQDAIRHCKKSGVSTSFWFTCTRWDERYTLDLYRAAIDAGADRIKTAGGGVLTVPAYKRLVRLLIGLAGGAEVGIHAHNNYGLADGAGLAAFEEVVMALTVMYGMDLGIKLERITELSRLVEEISGIAVQSYKPLVGKSVFLETPDTHIEGILRARIKGERTRDFIEPDTIGQKMTLLFGPSALGGKSIELKAEEMGIMLSGEQVQAVVDAMTERLTKVDALDEEEVGMIIRIISRRTAAR
jgi:isopropylmalate/homocitrate/citramalate synthase